MRKLYFSRIPIGMHSRLISTKTTSPGNLAIGMLKFERSYHFFVRSYHHPAHIPHIFGKVVATYTKLLFVY